MKRHKPKPKIQTPAQIAAHERNWNKFQLKGIENRLQLIKADAAKRQEFDNLNDAVIKIQIVLANWEKV